MFTPSLLLSSELAVDAPSLLDILDGESSALVANRGADRD